LALKIRYSLRARHDEIELIEYVLRNFGQKKAKEIYLRIETVLDEIAATPEMYPVSKKQRGLRKCVFSRQTSIYYRIQEDYVEVVGFRNNRQDPKNFKV